MPVWPRRAYHHLMARQSQDRCRICGVVGAVSKEHVIPKAAGNRGKIGVRTLNSIPLRKRRGELFQNGLTRSTLCSRCNSFCGLYYVESLVDWTQQAQVYHDKMKPGSGGLLSVRLNRLAFAKQMACMTLAMSQLRSIDLPHYVELRKFVLSRLRRSNLKPFRFCVYLHYGPPVFDGFFCSLNTTDGSTSTVFCHVGLEPIGYIVTADDPSTVLWADRLGLCDVTSFGLSEPGRETDELLWMPGMEGGFPHRPPNQTTD